MKTRGYVFISILIILGTLFDRAAFSSWSAITWISLPLVSILILSFYQQRLWPLGVAVLSGIFLDLYGSMPFLTYTLTLSIIAASMMVLVKTLLSHRSLFSLLLLSFISALLFQLIPFLFSLALGSVHPEYVNHLSRNDVLSILAITCTNLILGALTMPFYYRRPQYKIRPYLYS